MNSLQPRTTTEQEKPDTKEHGLHDVLLKGRKQTELIYSIEIRRVVSFGGEGREPGRK